MISFCTKGSSVTVPPSSDTGAPVSLLAKIKDEARFVRQWLGNPLSIGAITPSSPELARVMAGFLDPSASGRVVELGPGTGVVTDAILQHGIDPHRLTSIEYCSDFAGLLRQRFPNVEIVCGDAYDLNASLGPDATHLCGVVSSLPLFTSPYEKRRALIVEALDRLAPGAPFIQFSYALVPPVKAEAGLFSVSKTGWILNNVPPARVWVYRKVSAPSH
jgi:phosphatidylethanolamine/phosphatidyl-N-methylethanolamine N-methyltransferase